MRKNIKLIGVAAVFLALAACSDDKDENGDNVCLVDMAAFTSGTLDYQTCVAVTEDDDKALCHPNLGGELRSSCPADPVCDITIDGKLFKVYGKDANTLCDR